MASCDALSNALFFYGIVIGALVGFLGGIPSSFFTKWRDEVMKGKQTTKDLRNQFILTTIIFILGMAILLILGYLMLHS